MGLDPSSVLLTDRVALVTGGAAGIGAAIATAFARFGADVALCDRDADGLERTAAEIESTGRRAVTGVFDVRDAEAVAGFVGALGPLDIVVNNAGGTFEAAFAAVNPRGEQSLIAENFTSAAGLIRTALSQLVDGGSILNITSIEAHRAAPGFAVYAAMKAALANLTKSLALELADRRIRVNCIAPDVIPTPGVDLDLELASPLPYPGHVDDVAGAAVWLVGPTARFVTGTTIHVDGGNHAAGGWRRTADGRWRP